jgi:hypothetical protein
LLFVFVCWWHKAELDDVLCALHADEVKQVAVGMLGKAAIKVGPTASVPTNRDHPLIHSIEENLHSQAAEILCVG